MIAADTSAWIDFLKGVSSRHAQLLEACLSNGTLVVPTPVLFEILSAPGLTKETARFIQAIPSLELMPGFWERAAELRRSILRRSFKARSIDCLIAQNCMDSDVALIAADRDYRHFGGLRIAS